MGMAPAAYVARINPGLAQTVRLWSCPLLPRPSSQGKKSAGAKIPVFTRAAQYTTFARGEERNVPTDMSER